MSIFNLKSSCHGLWSWRLKVGLVMGARCRSRDGGGTKCRGGTWGLVGAGGGGGDQE